MKTQSPLLPFIALACFAFANAAQAQDHSYYTERLDDPKAVYLTATGDGVADDTEAVQKAINSVVENTTRGILFVPSGTYRISKTIEVWPGIRIIGYGKTRPVFLLGDDTPGYQGEPAYMFHFAGNIPGHRGNGAGFIFQPGNAAKPAIDFTAAPSEANPGTFYSALSNVDIKLGKGNPGAVAVRSTYAQHCFLAHIHFQIGSGLAAVNDGGNFCEDLHFEGGKYAIMTHTPSPGWQYCFVDSTFEGQTVAAIQSQLAGLTLIRPHFKNVPTAISMNADRGDQLWIKGGLMEDITGPALIIGNEENARNQINVVDVICRDTPVFAKFAQSGKEIAAPAPVYRVDDFSHGLHVAGGGTKAGDFTTETHSKITPELKDTPVPEPTDVTALPPQSTWTNVHTLGVKGDGAADDTEALRAAIASHRTLYFPSGAYRISNTLALRPDTVLVGLSPATTRIFIDDNCPAFGGLGAPVPMIEAPSGGTNVITGIGIYTNGINPRAVAVKWMAGEHSMINDVRFLGGHGTSQLSGEGEEIYNSNHSGDPNPQRRWDSQYPSLWITDGGGGTFMDIWTPSPYAQCGLMISHTSTPGRMYEISVEHHVRNEVRLQEISNWQIYALQLEEERGEGGFCQPLDVDRCHNVTIGNLFIYRVISSFQPFRSAVKISESGDIRFRGFHCWSNSKADFDNAIVDDGNGIEIRQREFASFVAENKPSPAPSAARVQKAAGGFFRLSGGAVDAQGRFYAVDSKKQRIYRWNGPDAKPRLITSNGFDPMNLACDNSGNLLVVSYSGSIYSMNPDQPESITILKPTPAAEHPGAAAILAGNYWTGGYDLVTGHAEKSAMHFVSPDGSVFIPANDDFITGRLSWGIKDHDLIRAYGLIAAKPGKPVYVTLEWDGRTYSADLDATGNLSGFKLFANRGGEAVATDPDGNVYIAEGQIFVYDKSGKLRDVITVPERPLGLVFGGKDHRTLYIPAGTSLYTFHTGK